MKSDRGEAEFLEKLKMDVLKLLNSFRTKHRLPPFAYDYFLDELFGSVYALQKGELPALEVLSRLGVVSYKKRYDCQVVKMNSDAVRFWQDLERVCTDNKNVLFSPGFNVVLFSLTLEGQRNICLRMLAFRNSILLEEMSWDLEFLKLRGRSLTQREVARITLGDGRGRKIEMGRAKISFNRTDGQFCASVHKTQLDSLLSLSDVRLEVFSKKQKSECFLSMAFSVDLSSRGLLLNAPPQPTRLKPFRMVFYMDSPLSLSRSLRVSRSLDRIPAPCNGQSSVYCLTERKGSPVKGRFGLLGQDTGPTKVSVQASGRETGCFLKELSVFSSFQTPEAERLASLSNDLRDALIKKQNLKVQTPGLSDPVAKRGLSFESIFSSETLTDLTLQLSDGREKRAHKLVLSASSILFRKILGGEGFGKMVFDFSDFPTRASIEAFLSSDQRNNYKADKIILPSYLTFQALECYLKHAYTWDIPDELLTPSVLGNLLKFSWHIKDRSLSQRLCYNIVASSQPHMFIRTTPFFLELVLCEMPHENDICKATIIAYTLVWLLFVTEADMPAVKTALFKVKTSLIDDILLLNSFTLNPLLSLALFKEITLRESSNNMNYILNSKFPQFKALESTEVFESKAFPLSLKVVQSHNYSHEQYLVLPCVKQAVSYRFGSKITSELLQDPTRSIKINFSGLKEGSMVSLTPFVFEEMRLHPVILKESSKLRVLVMPERVTSAGFVFSLSVMLNYDSKALTSRFLCITGSEFFCGTSFEISMDDHESFQVEILCREEHKLKGAWNFFLSEFGNSKVLEPKEKENFFSPAFQVSDFSFSMEVMALMSPSTMFHLLASGMLRTENENKVLLALVLYIEKKGEELSLHETELLLRAIRYNFVSFGLILEISMDRKNVVRSKGFKKLLETLIFDRKQANDPPRFSYMSEIPEKVPDRMTELVDWLLNTDLHTGCQTALAESEESRKVLRKRIDALERQVSNKDEQIASLKQRCQELAIPKQVKQTPFDPRQLDPSAMVKQYCSIF